MSWKHPKFKPITVKVRVAPTPRSPHLPTKTIMDALHLGRAAQKRARRAARNKQRTFVQDVASFWAGHG